MHSSSAPRVRPGGGRPMPTSSRSSLNVVTPAPSPEPNRTHAPPIPTQSPAPTPPAIPAVSPGPMRPKLSIQPIRPAPPKPGLKLSLAIPPRGVPRAPSPAPSFGGSNVDAPSDHSDSETGASPQHQHHHLSIVTTASEADMTIKPDSTKTVTPASVKRGAANGQPTITDLLANLKLPVLEGESADLSRLQWDDDQLEDLGRLGEGAGGSVNKVRDRKTGKVIAKKAIPQPSTPPVQLIRELQFISTCVHDNITVFYGAYLTPPKSKNGPELCLLMEFCEGGSLEAISRVVRKAKARIGEKVVGRVAESVLKGLAYLHTRKIIHRDIKPSNILVTRTGVIKLCDFGVSGELVDSVAGTFTGTGYYMAPERISGQQYKVQSDVWSTGLTLLELAMNKFPYPPDLGVIELLSYIVSGEVPKLTDEPGTDPANRWSEDMKDFIAVCLTVDAATRPPPRDMLQHPWIVKSEQTKVNMAKWVRQVWGWPGPTAAAVAAANPTTRRRRDVELERELERGFIFEEEP